jgi:hypothetical protein
MSVRPRFSPRPLDEEDEGYASENALAGVRQQDDAFCAAMRKAIAKGREQGTEGVMVTPPDEAKAILRPFVPATILTGSELV